MPEQFNEIKGEFVNDMVRFTKEDALAKVTGLMASYEQYVKNDTSGNW